MGRVFSGAQPTGNLHLGNYLGAIRNWVALQDSHECLFCVVDMHAITLWQDPAELRRASRATAAAYFAAGVDPSRSIVFLQSQNPVHAQLAWLLSCVARVGWLNRMTQFKDKANKDRENASVGLYTYPVLMAADILAYRATHVPVGDDQKQHLELARDIAQKFNVDYGHAFFPLPEPLIGGPAARVMSLRDGTKKMSKSDASDYSRINLTDDADTIALKLRKAKTDPEPLPDETALGPDGAVQPGMEQARPEAFNLMRLYGAMAGQELVQVISGFGGKEFSLFKKALADLAIAVLDPIAREYRRLLADPDALDRHLVQGAARARALSAPVIAECMDLMGFLHG
ncbi:MAG TPA: tryptophan--tRNA ligase [Dongiaceae bacterium]|jgi:tryptophanyl-tRNA synthetase|nr:tryptophan--tRNA ligase [Dongiaceae bacterium]